MKKDPLLRKIKGVREDVKCYAYVYALMKEAGICTACKIRFADKKILCRSCYEYSQAYGKKYWRESKLTLVRKKRA